MELQEQDSKAFEEIVSILQCHPEIEKFELAKEPILSLPGLEIYPSKRKVFRDRQEIQLTTKEYEIRGRKIFCVYGEKSFLIRTRYV